MRASKSSTRGFQVVELVVALAAFGLVTVVGVPPLLRMTSQFRVRLAAEELVGVLRGARWLAIRRSAEVAVKFDTTSGPTTFALYRDGNGDGVSNAEIRSGVDPLVEAARPLQHLGRDVRFGFPPGRPVRDPGDPSHWLDRTDDPIRFNDSDLASFSSLGTSTP